MRKIKSIIWFIVGKPTASSLENRLFSSLALLNGTANTLGALNYVEPVLSSGSFQSFMLFLLHLGSGLLLLLMYFISRLRGKYSVLFWPFVLSIFTFLFVNVLYNAGSQGGAHYYLITAVLIAVILAPGKIATLNCFVLGTGIAAILFWIEFTHPEWIQFFANPNDRIEDVPGSFIFLQILNGLLVLILRMHFNEEREKSERLLLNILPKSIAEELKSNDRVRPVDYEEATVIFTDFVGFTRFAEQLEPQDLIEKLDDSFRAFDTIIGKYKLEKIKTIGDSYMAVGGLPEVNGTHFLDAVLAGIELRQYMEVSRELYQNKAMENWELRIGVHTGHLVAGVIGEQKFAYDVWGDAVNIASRMESSSEPGKINISSDVYKRVKKYFECTYRGQVAAKNKGKIDMYFVERLNAPYSKDLDGLMPNETFWKAYHQIEKKGASS